MKAAVIEETAPTPTAPPGAVEGEGGVAVRRQVVDDDVGDLAEACPARVLGGDPGGVLEAGDRDDPVAVLLRRECHAHDRAVDAGVGGDDEHVLRVRLDRLPEVVHDGRLTLEGGPVEEDRRILAPEEHHVAQGDVVGRDESPGPAGDLHGEGLRVAGAERLHDAPGVERPHDHLDRSVQTARVGERPRGGRASWSPLAGSAQVPGSRSMNHPFRMVANPEQTSRRPLCQGRAAARPSPECVGWPATR